jgi:hypothetical protein
MSHFWFDTVCPAIGTSLYFVVRNWREALAEKRRLDVLSASESARLIGEHSTGEATAAKAHARR